MVSGLWFKVSVFWLMVQGRVGLVVCGCVCLCCSCSLHLVCLFVYRCGGLFVCVCVCVCLFVCLFVWVPILASFWGHWTPFCSHLGASGLHLGSPGVTLGGLFPFLFLPWEKSAPSTQKAIYHLHPWDMNSGENHTTNGELWFCALLFRS